MGDGRDWGGEGRGRSLQVVENNDRSVTRAQCLKARINQRMGAAGVEERGLRRKERRGKVEGGCGGRQDKGAIGKSCQDVVPSLTFIGSRVLSPSKTAAESWRRWSCWARARGHAKPHAACAPPSVGKGSLSSFRRELSYTKTRRPRPYLICEGALISCRWN